jgi:glycosyltransferase involved in cell wall biosynthesis
MEIMYYFQAKGFPIYVLSTGPKEDMDRLQQVGYQTIDVGSVVMNPIKALKYVNSLVREIKKINPEVIFSFTIRPNIFGSIVARILGKRIVSNVTGTGPLIADNSWLYKTIRWVYKFAFTTNQCVFFQNKDDYDYFLLNNYVKPYQAKLLPGSGVDTSYYLPIEKDAKLPFSFLMISRLIKDKGVIEYIAAARIVKKQFPEVQFQLLGPFWTQSIGKNTILKSEVDQWVSEGIVDYLGYTGDVRPYIVNTDCIVLPSYREGCANVLMQGASMERPLIASDVTGCNNLIEDEKSGYVFPVRNVEKLVNSLLKMIGLSPELRKAMGKLGRQKMITEYQKTIVLKAYENEVTCEGVTSN